MTCDCLFRSQLLCHSAQNKSKKNKNFCHLERFLFYLSIMDYIDLRSCDFTVILQSNSKLRFHVCFSFHESACLMIGFEARLLTQHWSTPRSSKSFRLCSFSCKFRHFWPSTSEPPTIKLKKKRKILKNKKERLAIGCICLEDFNPSFISNQRQELHATIVMTVKQIFHLVFNYKLAHHFRS